MVEQFLKLYDADHGFENMAKIVEKLQFNELMNQTAIDYLNHALGINDRFSFEVLQSATRGNYCQDLNQLHAFALMVNYLLYCPVYQQSRLGIHGSRKWRLGSKRRQFSYI